VLRRIRRRRNISVLLFTVNKILKPKSSIFFHHGIYVGAKIVRVLGKRIIIKAILHHPRGCRRRPAPVEIPPGTSPTEGRILSMTHPAVLGIFFIGNDIVVTPRGNSARLTKRLHIAYHRFCRAEKSRDIRMPIAHLKIYVQMIITAPRRRIGIVPYALKIGWQLIVFGRA